MLYFVPEDKIMDNSEYIEINGLKYRKNVGIVVFNDKGLILLCERIIHKKQFDYRWQFPQGGVDKGESEEQAALRELYEETGIKSATIVFKDDTLYTYNFPDDIKLQSQRYYKNNITGQAQTWFLMKFNGSNDEIKIPSDEFSNYKWCELSLDIANNIVQFKRGVYRDVILKMQSILHSMKF